MRKKLCLMLVIVTMIGALTGCGNALADSFDKDTVQNTAENFIATLNDRDYEAGFAMFSTAMQEALDLEKFEQTFEPVLDEAGAFVRYDNQQIAGSTNKTTKEDYAVCIFTAEYENRKITYTVTFNSHMKVDGLYYK